MIVFNELEAVVASKASEREQNLFLLLSYGVSFEKTGIILGVKEQRTRQIFNQLLDKLV